MPRKRVQVPDLERPEPIRPAPVQSDTFAAPAPPPINNDLERLERALGVFSRGVSQMQHEMEKQLRLQHLAEYERWKAATSPDAQLEAFRAGTAPYFTDPILEDVVKRDWAEREALALSAELDKDYASGTAGFGMAGFDPDAYIREKAAPYIERASRDPRLMVYFGQNLEKLRESTVKAHQEKLGVAQTEYFESLAAEKIQRAIIKGIEEKYTPEEIVTALRPIYQELGPRAKGGSLDIKYSRMDDLVLDVLESLAKDERYAETAFRLLHAERVGLEGSTRIGALSDVHRHQDKVAQIEALARKTLADKWERERKNELLAANIARLTRMDGSIWRIDDFNEVNAYDKERVTSVTAEKQREEAVSAWLRAFRTANGGENIAAELEVLMPNGIKHPELEKYLQQGYVGIANQITTNPNAPDQIEKIRELAGIYADLKDRNPVYAGTLVDEKAREFYELYWVLTRFAGRDGVTAAQEVAMAYSGAAGATKQPVQSLVPDYKIDNAINRVDFSAWPFSGSPINKLAVRQQLLTIANALARVENVDAEATLTKAADFIKRSAVLVNGRAVFSPGIQQGDEKHVQPILDAIFNRAPDYFKSKGIESSKDLSIAPIGSQQFAVVAKDGGAISVPVWKEDQGDVQRILGLGRAVIHLSDIQAIRAAGKARREAEELKALRESSKSFEERYREAPPLIRLNRDTFLGNWIAESLENLPRPGQSNLFGLSTEKEGRKGVLRPGRSNLLGLTDK